MKLLTQRLPEKNTWAKTFAFKPKASLAGHTLRAGEVPVPAPLPSGRLKYDLFNNRGFELKIPISIKIKHDSLIKSFTPNAMRYSHV